jgi:hypothetical protein
MFQHDNAQPHVTRICTRFLEAENVPVTWWGWTQVQRRDQTRNQWLRLNIILFCETVAAGSQHTWKTTLPLEISLRKWLHTVNNSSFCKGQQKTHFF